MVHIVTISTVFSKQEDGLLEYYSLLDSIHKVYKVLQLWHTVQYFYKP